MHPHPTDEQLKQLILALLDAFDRDGLTRLVNNRLNLDLAQIASSTDNQTRSTITLALVAYVANQNGGLKHLLSTALEAKPHNTQLHTLDSEWAALEFAPIDLPKDHFQHPSVMGDQVSGDKIDGDKIEGDQFNIGYIEGISVVGSGHIDIHGPVIINHEEIVGESIEGAEPAPGKSPYKSLKYFEVEDADIFFGREKLTAQLVQHIREHSFLAVIGASGSGKSSLVRAGMVAALKLGEELADGIRPPLRAKEWPIHIVQPSAYPLEALAATLAGGDESHIERLNSRMEESQYGLRDYVTELLNANNNHADFALLLIVDQFEELFTLCRDAITRKAFIDNLLAAAFEGNKLIRVVITLRADFYEYCAGYETLRKALEQNQRYIGRMQPSELRSAVEEPVNQGGWHFEHGLVDLILDEIGNEPGALPLLSHVLHETWERRRHRTLTFTGYQEAGRIQGAIAQTANRVFQSLNHERQNIARDIFLRLTSLGEGTQNTRRRAELIELGIASDTKSDVESVLKTLVDARLVTTSESNAEVAHEALIREWPLLREWLENNREALKIHRHLTETAHEWESLARDPGALYRGIRLENALEWADEHKDELNDLEQVFLQTSHTVVENERRREIDQVNTIAEERKRRIVILSIASVVAVILAVVAGWFAYISDQNARDAVTARDAEKAQRAEAERQKGIAEDNEKDAVEARIVAERQTRRLSSSLLATQSKNEIERNQHADDKALLLAREAALITMRAGDGITLDGDRALREAVGHSAWQMTLPIVRHRLAVRAIAFSPNGKTIVSASDDRTIRVWDAASGKQIRIIEGHTAGINSVAYSPDGQLIVSASNDKTIRVWDASSGDERQVWRVHTDSVNSVAYSPDGDLIVSASDDRTVRVWDASSGEVKQVLDGHTESVNSAIYSSDGKLIISASDDKTIRVWDASSGGKIQVLDGHLESVLSATVNPDGHSIISTSEITSREDRAVRLWNLETGNERQIMENPSFASIYAADFSPDGNIIAGASKDSVIRLWDALTGSQVSTMTGHMASVLSVSFSPDGETLASASNDFTVRLWDVASGQEIWPIEGHAHLLTSVAYSPDDKIIVSGGVDFTIRAWDTATGREVGSPLRGHSGFVNSVAFSPDGTMLASASHDHTVRLWDIETWELIETLDNHTDAVRTVVFSSDGSMVASAGEDQAINLWNSKTQELIKTLYGHELRIWTVDFSPDNKKIVSASSDRTIRIWDVESGETIHDVNGFAGSVLSAKFSPNGNVIASANDDDFAIRLWDVASGNEITPTLKGHDARINSLAFHPDGKTIVSASADESVRLWELETRSERRRLIGHTDRVMSAVFDSKGTKIASASFDRTIRLWNVPTMADSQIMSGHVARVWTTDVSPDGKMIASAGDDRTIRLWRVQDGQEVGILAGHLASVRVVAFSPDSKTLASASDDLSIRLWDIDSQQEANSFWRHSARIQAMAFSPDGRLIASASEDKPALKLWDSTTGEEIRTLEGHTARVLSVTFSSTGETIASTSDDGTIRLWDLESGDQVQLLQGHTESVRAASFSPDEKHIVTASDDMIIGVWNVQTGEQIHAMQGHTGSVFDVDFGDEPQIVASASEDQTIRLWNIETGQQIRPPLEGHTDFIMAVDFGPKDAYHGTTAIVSASFDRTVRVWVSTTEELMELAESRIQRASHTFNEEERLEFGIDN